MTQDYIKYLNRLESKDRKILLRVVLQIIQLEVEALDCKKMKGFTDIYRVRIGKWRIVFEKKESEGRIVDINTRGDIYK